jgi:hypothetical protein
MIKYNDKITALLTSVFSEGPVLLPEAYVSSTLMDVRRVMDAPSQLIREEPLKRASTLPKYLRTGEELPPWETELLAQMFAGRPFILVQGGSGCGKTSTLSFMHHHCRELPWNDAGPLDFDFRHVLLTIDLQDQPDHLKQQVDSESERRSQSSRFLAGLVDHLDTLLESMLSDRQLGLLFTKTFLELEGLQDHVTRAATVRHRIGVRYIETQRAQARTWKTIQPSLDSISDHDRVVARYLLLQELGDIQWREHGRSIVLAIDNIDPFPEYIQRDLLRTVETIAHGPAALGAAMPDHFSIVIFARLSTATRHSGTLDRVTAQRVNFRAPDPAELIFFKLSMFLLEPSGALGWDQLEHGDRDELLARGWFLWEQLANPKSQFSQVLSGLAGTNGRTGCRLARWWLSSPRLLTHMGGKKSGQETRIARTLAVGLLLRLAHAVARGIEPAKVSDPERWAEGVVRQFFANLLGVMLDFRVVRRRGALGKPGSDVRARLSEHARDHLVAFMRAPEWQHLRDLANAPVALAVYDAGESATHGSVRKDDLAGSLIKALKARELALRPQLERIEPSDTTLAQDLCMWLCDGAGKGAATTSRGAIDSERGGLLPDIIRPFERVSRPNRWEAVSILVSPESAFGRTQQSALNLFSADGNSLSPVALHILCQLEEKRQGLQGVVIRERLETWGFEQRQIMQALVEMVDLDRRLIYSSAKGARNGLAQSFDTEHVVRISSAGSSYLNRVAVTPAYLQWAFLGPAGLYERLGGAAVAERLTRGVGRLELVLEGLQLVYADELERVKHVARSSFDVQKSLSPLSWVFFGSLLRFIRDISGYKARDSQKIAATFLAFGERLRNERISTFGIFPLEWDHSLAEAQQVFKQRFGSKNALRS